MALTGGDRQRSRLAASRSNSSSPGCQIWQCVASYLRSGAMRGRHVVRNEERLHSSASGTLNPGLLSPRGGSAGRGVSREKIEVRMGEAQWQHHVGRQSCAMGRRGGVKALRPPGWEGNSRATSTGRGGQRRSRPVVLHRRLANGNLPEGPVWAFYPTEVLPEASSGKAQKRNQLPNNRAPAGGKR